ncbi:MAG: nucleotidyltransferase family protein [Planctomycetes bacterium]|nr:nucleotidyltransferase family protein [Planctomycetota bacterium]
MAVDRVEKRLRRTTAALDAAGIEYAVIGGNAVAAWVGRVDPGATRATKDVDLLVRRADVDDVAQVMADLGFTRHDLRQWVLFVDPEEPSKRAGVHLVWAGERVRPSYACPAPSLDEAVRDPEGFMVLDLPALVRMKLTSNRDIDRVHVADLSAVKLIDNAVRDALPADLRNRLDDIRSTMED